MAYDASYTYMYIQQMCAWYPSMLQLRSMQFCNGILLQMYIDAAGIDILSAEIRPPQA